MISAGSIQYPIDNVEMQNVGWACELDCFGPSATIAPPGTIEIKAEELRAVVCATPDLLQDARMPMLSISRAFCDRPVQQRCGRSRQITSVVQLCWDVMQG